ncbi:nucleoside triphosphate pyrophosphohydrolase [Candidatus Wolfebacteria bacterium]|nr:nucleoside triphosphate pyrophosphohydrolase [Candidatus Wolfebacteria bacterium]
MKKIYYNKLIRDKVAINMKKRGVAFASRKLNQKEFEKALIRKVGEEADGLLQARSQKEFIDELADILNVFAEVRKLKKIKTGEMKKALAKNMEIKGGFKKRIYLTWSADTGYKTNERRYKS